MELISDLSADKIIENRRVETAEKLGLEPSEAGWVGPEAVNEFGNGRGTDNEDE